MKTISANDALKLLEGVEAGLIAQDEAKLPPPDDFKASEHWLNWGVATGKLNATTVTLAGAIIATVYYYVTVRPERVLVIAAARSYAEHDIAVELHQAVDKIASNNDCPFVEMHTRRPGMLRKCLPFGWKVSCVVMKRRIQNERVKLLDK